jgi:hypothetical protein
MGMGNGNEQSPVVQVGGTDVDIDDGGIGDYCNPGATQHSVALLCRCDVLFFLCKTSLPQENFLAFAITS